MSHRCEQPCNNNRRIPFAFLWKQGERNDREGFDFPSRRDERRGIRGRLINHPEKIVRFLSKKAVSSWSPDPDNICSITRRTWLIYSPLPLWIDSLVLQSTLLESSLYLKMSMHRSTDGNRSSTQILLHRSCTDRSYIYIYIYNSSLENTGTNTRRPNKHQKSIFILFTTFIRPSYPCFCFLVKR